MIRIAGTALAVTMTLGVLAGCERPKAPAEPTEPEAGAAPAREPAQALFTGLGNVHFPVTTTSEDAQRYFDQGLALAYAFNHAAADLAFTEAATHDPDCAMCYWGSALVLGPNVNAGMDPANAPRAHVLITKAAALAESAMPREQALIEALLTRYEATAAEDRSHLDRNYAQSMRAVAAAHAGNVDVLALAAEALMDVHPWDFWLANGDAQPWTGEIVELLERALAQDADHIGAIHLYIHAVEQSNDANRAAAYADRLAGLAPTAGHLVHMPAHIYIRVGRYHDATLNNIAATQADQSFLSMCRANGPIYRAGYVPHNWHFGWVTAAIEGWSAKAFELAKGTAEVLPPELIGRPEFGVAQHYAVQPLFAYVRFGRWDDVLATPEPEASLVYSRAAWNYAVGRAQLGKGNIEAAEGNLRALDALIADTNMAEITFFDINNASDIADVAATVLRAEIAAAKGELDAAIEGLKQGVEMEDELNYTEPPDWFYPVRHSLGAVQLLAGDAEAAEKTYREDLAVFPENGWSLFGLAQALRAQGKTAEADEAKARFDKAWAHADIELTTTRL